MSKIKKILVICFTFGLLMGSNNVKGIEVNAGTIEITLNDLVNEYYNYGYYQKDTSIYLTETAKQEVIVHSGFHNDVSELERTTYFTGNELWMTNESGSINSGYGTNEDGNMTHFSKNGDVKVVDYVVDKSHPNWHNKDEDGMEGFYITLKDVKLTESQVWSLDGGSYISRDSVVIEWFKAITAPCYIGFEEATKNYIDFSHVEIIEKSNSLELSLYANAYNYSKLTTDDGDESTPDLFSKAVIYKSSIPSENSIVNLDFYNFNDTHGKLRESETTSGISKISTYFKNKQQEENTILLSSGDMWQGAIESNSTKGYLMTEWMNYLDFASMTLGNHEFDWTSQWIKNNKELADFSILAINVIDKATNERANYCDSSVVIEREGIRIGVIGAIGDCYSSISASMVQDVEFIVGNELTNLVKEESVRLRKEENCDAIIYSVHDDYNAYDLSLSDGYVDLVFEGHSHNGYVIQDSMGVYHLQTNGDNKYISHVDVDFDKQNNEFKVNYAENISTLTNSFTSLIEDEYTESLFTKYAPYYEKYTEVIGYNDAYRSPYELKQLSAKMYLDNGIEKWGENYDIVLGGGYISCRGDGLSLGDVTYADIQTMFPFDNDVYLCSIPGSALKTRFYENTNSNYYIEYSTYGDSIRNSIKDTETYYVITDTYNIDYKDNQLTAIEKLADYGYYDDPGCFARDLIVEYIAAGNYGEMPETPDTPLEPEVPTPSLSHTGTIYDPYNVKDAIILAKDKVKETAVYGYYYVTVSDVSSINVGSKGDLGNFYVQDSDGTSIYIYYLSKCYNSSSTNNWSGSSDIKVGDKLLIYGNVYTYNSNPQFGSGNICITLNNSPTNGLTAESACDALLARFYCELADALGTTFANMYVIGEITYIDEQYNATYKNSTFEVALYDEDDILRGIKIYRGKVSEEDSNKVQIGAKVLISNTTLMIYHYSNETYVYEANGGTVTFL